MCACVQEFPVFIFHWFKLTDDISDFVYFLLEAEKQATEDPSEDIEALHMLGEKHILGILADIFLGKKLQNHPTKVESTHEDCKF